MQIQNLSNMFFDGMINIAIIAKKKIILSGIGMVNSICILVLQFC